MEGVPAGQVGTLLAIKEALESAGVEFIGTPTQNPSVCMLQGRARKAMSPRPNKSAGGPKTAKGKRVSSQNALVHGATSNSTVSAAQMLAVEQYVLELTDFYKSESPLEELQIQRIALCKVKLDALYQLEQVKLQIVWGLRLTRSCFALAKR